MKKIFFLLAAAAAVMIFGATAGWAQTPGLPTLEISSGANGGTYAKLAAQMSEVCRDEVPTHVTLSPGGSEMNVDRLSNNEASIGFAQADQLWLSGQTQDLSNVKVLLALSGESLHFIVLRNSRHMIGGHMGLTLGAHPVVINTVADLGVGIRLAASGGAKTSAMLVAKQTGLGFELVPVETSVMGLQQLMAGQVDAVLMVGAAPLDILRNAPAASKDQIKLIPIPENLLSILTAKGYMSARVGYSGIGDGSAVQTVSVQSLLLTQNYSSRVAMAKSAHALKKCLLEKAPDQAAIPGMHPAWHSIGNAPQPKWDMWQDPVADSDAAAPTVATPVKAKAKK